MLQVFRRVTIYGKQLAVFCEHMPETPEEEYGKNRHEEPREEQKRIGGRTGHCLKNLKNTDIAIGKFFYRFVG